MSPYAESVVPSKTYTTPLVSPSTVFLRAFQGDRYMAKEGSVVAFLGGMCEWFSSKGLFLVLLVAASAAPGAVLGSALAGPGRLPTTLQTGSETHMVA